MAKATRLRLGTRASQLALWQAEWVAAQLTSRGAAIELITLTTEGDAGQTQPISSGGSVGVFTRRIQQALLAEEVDLAVHSLKDLPTEVVDGLELTAVPRRESVADVLICRQAESLDGLADGAVVGTGSLRRQAQLLAARPDLAVRDIRGNVDTRLAKLDRGDYDAVVLAEAGLKRLGLAERITQVLPVSIMLPAVGQGALGIESRANDAPTREALSALDHEPSHQAVLAERSMLAALRGGCLAPVGAWARIEGERLRLSAIVLSHDGRAKLEETSDIELSNTAPTGAVELGQRVAEALSAAGADDLIKAARDVLRRP